MRALLSVYDKTGIVEFARGLVDLDVELYSTGGTEALLNESGVPVKGVQEITGFPEVLGGRVKTLHPLIYSGILALRDDPAHMEQLNQLNAEPFDLIAVNLYPFLQTIRERGGGEHFMALARRPRLPQTSQHDRSEIHPHAAWPR